MEGIIEGIDYQHPIIKRFKYAYRLAFDANFILYQFNKGRVLLDDSNEAKVRIQWSKKRMQKEFQNMHVANDLQGDLKDYYISHMNGYLPIIEEWLNVLD